MIVWQATFVAVVPRAAFLEGVAAAGFRVNPAVARYSHACWQAQAHVIPDPFAGVFLCGALYFAPVLVALLQHLLAPAVFVICGPLTAPLLDVAVILREAVATNRNAHAVANREMLNKFAVGVLATMLFVLQVRAFPFLDTMVAGMHPVVPGAVRIAGAGRVLGVHYTIKLFSLVRTCTGSMPGAVRPPAAGCSREMAACNGLASCCADATFGCPFRQLPRAVDGLALGFPQGGGARRRTILVVAHVDLTRPPAFLTVGTFIFLEEKIARHTLRVLFITNTHKHTHAK